MKKYREARDYEIDLNMRIAEKLIKEKRERLEALNRFYMDREIDYERD